MFQVAYDRVTNRLVIKVAGFFKLEDVASFATEIGVKATEARAIRPDFDVLVESFEFPVQAMDVAGLLGDVMQAGMTMTTGRAAVVVAGQLNRLQAERTLVHPSVRVFMALDRANEWLAATAES